MNNDKVFVPYCKKRNNRSQDKSPCHFIENKYKKLHFHFVCLNQALSLVLYFIHDSQTRYILFNGLR